jgi:hypothetical protein
MATTIPHQLARISRAGLVLIGLAILAGCASQGSISNPFERRAVWVDYISGGDIRRACAQGTLRPGSAYRFVEYRNRADQVRVYEARADDGHAPALQVRVLRGGIRLDGWSPFTDPLQPFRGTEGSARLTDTQFATIKTQARADGLMTAPPVDRKIASRSYFWLASACTGDGFAFQVWEWPAQDYRNLAFADTLHELDPTDLALNPAPQGDERLVNSPDRQRQRQLTGDDPFPHYDLIVQETGVSLGRSYSTR